MNDDNQSAEYRRGYAAAHEDLAKAFETAKVVPYYGGGRPQDWAAFAIRTLAKPNDKTADDTSKLIADAMERSKPLVRDALKLGRQMIAAPGLIGSSPAPTPDSTCTVCDNDGFVNDGCDLRLCPKCGTGRTPSQYTTQAEERAMVMEHERVNEKLSTSAKNMAPSEKK